MKYLIYFLLITFSLNAQDGYKTISLRNGHKKFWDIAKPDISKSPCNYVVRYETKNQIVNLYSNDSINFTGSVLSYLIEQKTSRESTINHQYVYNISILSNEKCSSIGRKLLSEKFYNLPTDDSIRGYSKNWLDCFGIRYSFKIGGSILYKNFSCPWSWAQNDTIPEIVKLIENYTLIDSVFQLKKIEQDFERKLEKGKSYSDGFTISYKMTDRQSAIWKKYKPISNYLKTKRDTIDLLLKKHIDINYKSKDMCFDDFQLTFSKKGTLKKISVSTPFLERLFDKDYRRCRKKIKNLFRKFNLKELHLKYGFERELNFDLNDKPYIYDRTLYFD